MPLFIFCTQNNDPRFWRYRASADNIDELLKKCYDDEGSLPKNQYSGKLRRNASLASCQTGNPTNGSIYELTLMPNIMNEINYSDGISKAKNLSRKLSVRARNYFGKNTLLIIAAFSFILASCGYSKNLTGRYKEATAQPIATFKDSVKVKGYVLNPEPSAPAAPFRPVNLATDAQVRLIRELGDDMNDPEKMIKLLGTPIIAKEDNSPAIIKKYSYSKRIVLSVRNKSPFPENRISKLEIDLTEPNNKIVFTGCNKIVTEYQTVDQGKLTFKNTVTGEISASTETGPSSSIERNFNEVSSNGKGGFDTATVKSVRNAAAKAGAGGKLGFARELYEEAAVKQRYVSLSASVNSNEVSMYQESISGIDLSGNIIADVEFEIPEDKRITEKFYQFETKDNAGAFLLKDKVKMKTIYEVYPDVATRANDITLNLTYNGVFRKIIKGGKTQIEGDDIVNFQTGTHTEPNAVMLVSRYEMTPKKWYLQDAAGNQLQYSKSNAAPAASLRTIYFRDYFSAKAIIDWLMNNAVTSAPAPGAALASHTISEEKIYFYLGGILLTDANKLLLEINVQGL